MASKSKVHDLTPVIVGVGRYTFKRKDRPQEKQRFGLSPLEMMLEASRRAAKDAGLDLQCIELNSIATISAATDAHVLAAASNGKKMRELGDDRMLYANPSGTVAAALGCPVASVRELVTTGDSGSMPQSLVNRAFEKISQGKLQSALILGGEAMHSFSEAQKQGATAAEMKARWSDAELDNDAAARLAQLNKSVGLSIYPEGKTRDEAGIFFTEHGRKHGIGAPSTVYPLIENAIRVESGCSLNEQQEKAAKLFAGLSEVAGKEQEHSWFGTAYTPAELATPSEDNRPIVHPFYLKRMNSVMAVDMSAAVLVMSAREARRRGVPENKWIFMHGCGQGEDTLEFLERPSLCGAPAVRIAGGRALQAAGVQDVNRDIQHFDVYSCFPSAVQVACKELGISENDPKALTVTGGLPYHGGPGSNYVTHSIAAMAEKLREHPTSEHVRGLVTANGGYLTKHSFGVYANFPDEAALHGTWHREDPAVCQAEIDALPREKVAMQPEGTGVVETYAVRYGRKDPEMVVIIGKMVGGSSKGQRFVANTARDPSSLQQFVDGDPIGALGEVTVVKGKAVFKLQAPVSKL